MPATDSTKVNLHTRRVLGKIDVKDRWFDYTEEMVRRHHKILTTGVGPLDDDDTGGWFTTISVTDGSGSDHLVFSGSDGEDSRHG